MTESDQKPEASAADVELFDFYVAQLEAYLDGELNSGEAQEVRQRLMQEEAYAAALGRLHAQRVQRVEVFQEIERKEIDESAASRVAASARTIALHDRSSHSWPTWTKVAFGMAACLLVGFGAGWIGDLNTGRPPAIPNPTPLSESFAGASGKWVYFDSSGKPQTMVPASGQPIEIGAPEDKTMQDPPR